MGSYKGPVGSTLVTGSQWVGLVQEHDKIRFDGKLMSSLVMPSRRRNSFKAFSMCAAVYGKEPDFDVGLPRVVHDPYEDRWVRETRTRRQKVTFEPGSLWSTQTIAQLSGPQYTWIVLLSFDRESRRVFLYATSNDQELIYMA